MGQREFAKFRYIAVLENFGTSYTYVPVDTCESYMMRLCMLPP